MGGPQPGLGPHWSPHLGISVQGITYLTIFIGILEKQGLLAEGEGRIGSPAGVNVWISGTVLSILQALSHSMGSYEVGTLKYPAFGDKGMETEQSSSTQWHNIRKWQG